MGKAGKRNRQAETIEHRTRAPDSLPFSPDLTHMSEVLGIPDALLSRSLLCPAAIYTVIVSHFTNKKHARKAILPYPMPLSRPHSANALSVALDEHIP